LSTKKKTRNRLQEKHIKQWWPGGHTFDYIVKARYTLPVFTGRVHGP